MYIGGNIVYHSFHSVSSKGKEKLTIKLSHAGIFQAIVKAPKKIKPYPQIFNIVMLTLKPDDVGRLKIRDVPAACVASVASGAKRIYINNNKSIILAISSATINRED